MSGYFFLKFVHLSHFIKELLTYLLNHTLTCRHASLSLDYVVIADCSEHLSLIHI